ncbi:MAG: lytic murein transglycosylase B [Betaproteobacteria bacterium]|nr:lytic murein transglycosylase B [Betaproteobacteria bacterium]
MKWRARIALAAFGLSSLGLAQSPSPLRADVEFFIANMVERHGMDAQSLRELFANLKSTARIVKAVSAPATAKPWHEFRPLFVDKKRIEGGVKFWNDNQAALTRASEAFRVPEALIVSIIGIETRYGKQVGTHRVLDALYTLGFELPGRNEYFKSEMEEFLLLAREKAWDPRAIKGSYAGAMGLPQFMPSSYRKYAIDFSENDKVDLWTEVSDVIGSVANYMNQFGWRDGEPVAIPARFEGSDAQALLALGLKPHTSIYELKQLGVVPVGEVDESLQAALFTLDVPEGQDYWLGLNNFNTILQYNRSRNYAMSVHQLSLEIARERERLALAGQELSGKPGARLAPR